MTRLEVIDHAGQDGSSRRRLVLYGVSVSLELQDGARTLKIFVEKSPESGTSVRQDILGGLTAE